MKYAFFIELYRMGSPIKPCPYPLYLPLAAPIAGLFFELLRDYQ